MTWRDHMPRTNRRRRLAFAGVLAGGLLAATGIRLAASAARDSNAAPQVWDVARLSAMQMPLALGPKAHHVSSDYYYRIPVRKIYESYPVYHPDREPAGYMQWLESQEPKEVPDVASDASEEELRAAGKRVFEAPIFFDLPHDNLSEVRNPSWYKQTRMPVAATGVMPFYRYVVREKGRVDVGTHSCATCHTRVLEDGSTLEGAQGNYPFEQVYAYIVRRFESELEPTLARARIVGGERLRYGAPWLNPDPMQRVFDMSLEQIATLHGSIPPGVMSRTNTSPVCPVQVTDLFGVAARPYFDHTGFLENRSIGDLMRYVALVQGASTLVRYDDVPNQPNLPDPKTLQRYSDAQLRALAHYVYSLTAPPAPAVSADLQARGRAIFEREGCDGCHAGPLYSNGKLLAVAGNSLSHPPPLGRPISPRQVGTDPCLALYTRKGTGYYRVPSLLGVRYRGPLGHAGAAQTLEEWFDRRRLEAPGSEEPAFNGRGKQGHRYGLDLSEEDRRTLIAFLRTL